MVGVPVLVGVDEQYAFRVLRIFHDARCPTGRRYTRAMFAKRV